MFSRSCICLIIISLSLCWNNAISQVVFSEATKIKREKLYHYLNQLIDTSLAAPLTLQNEDQWMQTFYPLQLLQKRSNLIDGKIAEAVHQISRHNIEFQLALLELIYANYPSKFQKDLRNFLIRTNKPEAFVMGAEYLLREDPSEINKKWLLQLLRKLKTTESNNIATSALKERLIHKYSLPYNITSFFKKEYLPGNVLIVSFQRKNRNYPGLLIIRDTTGQIVTDSNGYIFSIPQLARSISGLPYYVTNGNTPQGIFRMKGFDHSKSSFIGPTLNIQMTMPFETSASIFLGDSSYADIKLTLPDYIRLLPSAIAHYEPLYESFFAGLIGRNEIISHGTAIDPELYTCKSYYPFTPTLGCLCTQEIWNENGVLDYSDQEKLISATVKAGGPSGYVIVLDIDDQKKPVTIEEINKLINQSNY